MAFVTAVPVGAVRGVTVSSSFSKNNGFAAVSAKPQARNLISMASPKKAEGRSKYFDLFQQINAPNREKAFYTPPALRPNFKNARAASTSISTRAVDDYITACAQRQYIAAQNGSGVYSQSCTEGTVSGAAEASRVASLAVSFRRNQEAGVASFNKLYETRRMAFALANGCNYEEKLIGNYPEAARMTVVGTAEKFSVCSRYATPNSLAEKYMAECVERAKSASKCSGGVYASACGDGSVKGAAEEARIASLATAYRVNTMNPIAKEQKKFDQSKFARDYYSNGCNYEDELFAKFPAVAAGMVNY